MLRKEKYEELKNKDEFWHRNWLALKEALYEALQNGQISRELYHQLDDRSLHLMRKKFWIEKEESE